MQRIPVGSVQTRPVLQPPAGGVPAEQGAPPYLRRLFRM